VIASDDPILSETSIMKLQQLTRKQAPTNGAYSQSILDEA